MASSELRQFQPNTLWQEGPKAKRFTYSRRTQARLKTIYSALSRELGQDRSAKLDLDSLNSEPGLISLNPGISVWRNPAQGITLVAETQPTKDIFFTYGDSAAKEGAKIGYIADYTLTMTPNRDNTFGFNALQTQYPLDFISEAFLHILTKQLKGNETTRSEKISQTELIETNEWLTGHLSTIRRDSYERNRVLKKISHIMASPNRSRRDIPPHYENIQMQAGIEVVDARQLVSRFARAVQGPIKRTS